MSVRRKIALTIVSTGLITTLAVLATVVYAFERFERETTYQRARAFLQRVVSLHDNIFDMHERAPEELVVFLKSLVLFETDTQLYLLSLNGKVLATTGDASLPAGYKVALDPIHQSITRPSAAFVLGSDPERASVDAGAGAVIAAHPLRRALIRNSEPMAGYLYLVARRTHATSRWRALSSSFGPPALGLIAAIVAFTTLLATLVVASVTRPLQQLTAAVATLSEQGLQDGAQVASPLLPAPSADEIGQLTRAFSAMLGTLRSQWDALRHLDRFRREAVSNLSHDLRSPLTATAACLETLETRWTGLADRREDRSMIEVALRNTRNAARLVQSMGDLATLDEPTFKLRLERVDLQELLADISLRFTERARQLGATLDAQLGHEPVAAEIDIELFERAIANIVDNALKFCGAGCQITLSASLTPRHAEVLVQDNGPGILAEHMPHLFDRFYQARHTVAPATGAGGKGLGLAIVKRIAQLHGGDVTVSSAVGLGTVVRLLVALNNSPESAVTRVRG